MAKAIVKWALAAIVTLVIPVLLWNVIFLNYIDMHGKFLAWVFSPVFAFLSAVIIVGLSYANGKVESSGHINPFFGWFGICLALEFFIVALSNT